MCGSTPLSLLVRVVISGKVGASTMGNFTVGMPVKMSFLADQKAMYRFAEGNVVMDGIAPHQICPEDFKLTFGSKQLEARLGDAPPNGAICALALTSHFASAAPGHAARQSPSTSLSRLASVTALSSLALCWQPTARPEAFTFR